jgi:hypothetical protein
MSEDDFWRGYGSGWNHDLELIDPVIDHPGRAIYHPRTGTMAMNYILRGGWTDSAFDELRRCFEIALPERYSFRVLYRGSLRLAVFLGVTGSGLKLLAGGEDPRWEDDGDVDPTLDRADWAFDRAVARLEGKVPRGPEPEAVAALVVQDERTRRAFAAASASMGDLEVIRAVEDRDPGYRSAAWVRLDIPTSFDVSGRSYSYHSRTY